MAISTIANAEVGSSVRTKLNDVIALVNGAIPEGTNAALGTSTGSKIGTATNQKLGFWNATPVVQPSSGNQAAVSATVDVTGSDTVDQAQLETILGNIVTLLNQLRSDLVTTGIIKGSS